MDHNQNDPESPDQVVGITIDDDYDADGVPDSLDNGPETPNPGQQDTDGDMYGNACDADFNNDDNVGSWDYYLFKQAYGSSEGDPNWNPDADMTADGNVGFSDYYYFKARYGSIAPYY